MSDAREELSRRIAGEITLSDDPGATLRKWRTDFDVSQTELADQLDVSSSVVSTTRADAARARVSASSGGRSMGSWTSTSDAAAGGSDSTRASSAGFESDIVHDLREYSTAVPPKSSTRRWARRRSCAASRTTSTATPSSTRSRRSPVSRARFSTGCTASRRIARSCSPTSPAASRRWSRCGS